jgi:hypothetical protein
LLLNPPLLSRREFEDLVAFVRTGLLDTRARRANLCALIPPVLPSGMPPLRFEECLAQDALTTGPRDFYSRPSGTRTR